ncbi:hypothetical protein [Plasmodium yoelii yoelii]|uniref:Thioredoxin domain-containing protein n=1 Tax=Plasmodium yoelii yoelii TaxID=73239 RepID=Q7RRY1_PLAYO|nr:hypothetical protein [Plasmodium yoelii yoelii]
MKRILALLVFIISFFCFKDVNCVKDFPLPSIESPLTALNKYDKFYLRMYNKMPRLEQSGTDYINDKLEKNFGKKVHIIRIDIDNNEEIAKKNFIKALPTTIIIKNKIVIAKNEHYVTSNELTSTIRKHL